MVSLARKNLLEDLPRFLVAQVGIMFAVTLVTLQTGIFTGFTRSTGQLIHNSNADIWLASDEAVQIELTVPIPLSDVIEARKVAGVARAEPLIFSGALWRPSQGEISRVRIIGFDPDGKLFAPKNIQQGRLSALQEPYTVIVDKTDLDTLNVSKVGDSTNCGHNPRKQLHHIESFHVHVLRECQRFYNVWTNV
jgi:putative ABC transport system permease protein